MASRVGTSASGTRPCTPHRSAHRTSPPWSTSCPSSGLLATQAEGISQVRGADELRVKESDRIAVLVAGLRALGADVEELPDGFVVAGPTPLTGGDLDSAGDHRMAMVFAVAALIADGPVRVRGMESVGDSFPGIPHGARGRAMNATDGQRVFAVVGDPVAHSVSPPMQRAAFAAARLDATYVAERVPRRDARGGVARTSATGSPAGTSPGPLKEAALAPGGPRRARGGGLRIGEHRGARRTGRTTGHSTDGDGFLAALAAVRAEPVRRAVILGTGGATRAVAAALAGRGTEVRLVGRNEAAGRAVAADLSFGGTPVTFAGGADRLAEVLPRADLIVNATPLGDPSMPGRSPIPDDVALGAMDPRPVVFDLVYWPRRTAAPGTGLGRGMRRRGGHRDADRTGSTLVRAVDRPRRPHGTSCAGPPTGR